MINSSSTADAPAVALGQAMNRLANEAFVGDPFRTLWARPGGPGNPVSQALPLDVYATDDEAVLVAAVPGMGPESLDLTVHQNTVTLAGTMGETVDPEEAKGATWYVHELWTGQFRRSVTLPFPVDADQADARFEHGVLRVTLPKAESAKPKKIAVGGLQQQAIGAGGQSQG